MRDHVRILAILHIVFGALGALAAVALLFLFGGMAGLVGLNERPEEAAVAIPVMMGVGLFLFVLLAALSVPGIICGLGLMNFRPWARILGIVLSAISLLNVPIGTALGIYGLWVLLSERTLPLFEQAPAPPAPRPSA